MTNISKPRHCPACGSETLAGTDECPHCALPLTMDGGAERTMFKCTVTKERAIEIVRNWWAGLLMAYDLNRKSRIIECSLRYVPFWKLRARALGYVKGYALQGCENDVDLNIKVDEYFVWNEIACDSRDIGMKHIDSLDCETMPYDAHAAQVLDVTISKRAAMTYGRSAIEEKAVNSVYVPHVTSKSMTVIPLEIGLIHYPLWTLKYTYQGQAYSAIVDGVAGGIVAGRAPGDYTLMRVGVAAGLLACAVVASLTVYVMIASLMEALCPLAGIAAICLIFTYEAFAFYSNGSVISCGGFKDGYRPFDYGQQYRPGHTTGFARIDVAGKKDFGGQSSARRGS